MEVDVQLTWIYVSSFLYPPFFIAFFALLAANAKRIAKHFSGVSKTAWTTLAVIFLLSLAIRTSMSVQEVDYRTSAWEYMTGARSIIETGTVRRCDAGSFNACLSENCIAHPAGYSYALALAFLVAGASTQTAIFVQIIASSLAVAVLFLAMFMATKKETHSLLAAAFMATLPLHVVMSSDIGAGEATFSTLFESVAIMLLFLSLREKTKLTKYLAVLSLAVALSFRFQNIILYAVFALIWLTYNRRFNVKHALRSIGRNKALMAFAALTAMLPFFIGIHHWFFNGIAFDMFSPLNAASNAPSSVRLLMAYFMPHLLGLAFFMPLALWKKASRPMAIACVIWIAAFVAFYMSFSAGFGSRYAMNLVVPMSAAFGLGAGALVPKNGLKVAALAAILMVCAWPLIGVQKPKVFGPLSEVVSAINATPPESTIIISVMNTGWGLNFLFPEREVFSFENFHKIERLDDAYFIDTGWPGTERYIRAGEYLSSLGTRKEKNDWLASVHLQNVTEAQLIQFKNIIQ